MAEWIKVDHIEDPLTGCEVAHYCCTDCDGLLTIHFGNPRPLPHRCPHCGAQITWD